jgi:hypothetical protein
MLIERSGIRTPACDFQHCHARRAFVTRAQQHVTFMRSHAEAIAGGSSIDE